MIPKCNKYSDNQLFTYLQGRCATEDEEAIQLHIMSCEYCFEKVTKIRQVSNKLAKPHPAADANEGTRSKHKKLVNPMIIALSSAAAIVTIAIIAYNKLAPEDTTIPIGKDPGTIYHNIDSMPIKKDSTIVIDQFDEIEIIEDE